MHTLTVRAGRHHVTVRSDTASVTDWAGCYFATAWPTTPGRHAEGPAVTATAHPAGPPGPAPAAFEHQTHYAREAIGYTRHCDGTVDARTTAVPHLRYRYTPAEGHLAITAETPPAPAPPGRPSRLATATTRFTRELMRAQLLDDGWVLLHAAAAVLDDGTALLALGDSGAGKTTTALTLASFPGARLLATDCAFARPTPGGRLDLLPWPSAATIGLGLLHALGWSSIARARLSGGEHPHPTQHPDVTAALLTEGAAPPHTPVGRERKAHIWPDQLTRWFGLTPATEAVATAVLLPRITPGATARADTGCDARITHSPFAVSDGPERYPDLLGLTLPGAHRHAEYREAVLAYLAALPARAVDLGHSHDANTRLLATLASDHAITAAPEASR
ncbi:hypothetical protein [Kitasatospora sp. NPDC088783]|uniref:hypothetical protein n=1 Tax=Kitasatospora sp. NPDC088783 TaxID=3364077 RepID=UPI003817915E